MTVVLGWDIGGANIKLTVIRCKGNAVSGVKIFAEYFPVWKRGREKLSYKLKSMVERVGSARPDLAAITMTAELSDVYFSKREGVNHIIDSVEKAMPTLDLRFLDVHGRLLTPDEARKHPLKVAAANWYASGWLASKLSDTCLLVDTGSTSTSIVPVVEGKVAAKGLNDLEKLMAGELVYTGALRTNVVAIVSHVPVRGVSTPVSSEFFAQSGDIHLLLGHITAEDYTVDTPDGRGVSMVEAAARVARVVCADLDLLSMEEVKTIASYVYEAQLGQILEALKRLTNSLRVDLRTSPAYVAGVGGEFIALPALKMFGFRNVKPLSRFIGSEAAKAAPSYALALMAAEFLKGRELRNWRLS